MIWRELLVGGVLIAFVVTLCIVAGTAIRNAKK